MTPFILFISYFLSNSHIDTPGKVLIVTVVKVLLFKDKWLHKE